MRHFPYLTFTLLSLPLLLHSFICSGHPSCAHTEHASKRAEEAEVNRKTKAQKVTQKVDEVVAKKKAEMEAKAAEVQQRLQSASLRA